MKRIFLSILVLSALLASSSGMAYNSDDEQLLRSGPISGSSYFWGGVLSMVPGFGVGHAVQGRYAEKGWIYTLGEAGALAGAYAVSPHCLDSTGSCDGFIVFAALAGAFKIWEMVDAWITPPQINAQYDRLRWNSQRKDYSFLILPTRISRATGLALNIKF